MSGENWTPGPWTIKQGGGHAPDRIEGSDVIHVSGFQRNRLGISSASYTERVCENLGDLSLPGPSANANLIAAAPDLYEALNWASDLPYAGGKRLGDVDPVKSALAKARGEI